MKHIGMGIGMLAGVGLVFLGLQYHSHDILAVGVAVVMILGLTLGLE